MALIDDVIRFMLDESETAVLTASEKRNPEITKNNLILSEDEIIVKSYKCSEMQRPKCTGNLTVTNKRTIFHSYGTGSRMVDEVQLSSISGLSTFYGGYTDFTRLKIGVILIIVGVISIFMPVILNTLILLWIGVPLAIIVITLGGIFVDGCRRKAFFLNIYASQSSPAISVGMGYGTLGGNNATFALIAEPTDETDKMMLELGALFNDLQTQGDLAIGKWKDK